MATSNIRVLALDLDGTLTNDQKEITPRTRAALERAMDQGVTVVLASGRPTAGVRPVAQELGLDQRGGCIHRNQIFQEVHRLSGHHRYGVLHT